MNHDANTAILSEVANYYTDKLAQHGETPRGVDWNGTESQVLRFEQLGKILPASGFSLNDLGCGYGALLDYFQDKHPACDYLGVDVSPDMIQAASQRHARAAHARFIAATRSGWAARTPNGLTICKARWTSWIAPASRASRSTA